MTSTAAAVAPPLLLEVLALAVLVLLVGRRLPSRCRRGLALAAVVVVVVVAPVLADFVAAGMLVGCGMSSGMRERVLEDWGDGGG